MGSAPHGSTTVALPWNCRGTKTEGRHQGRVWVCGVFGIRRGRRMLRVPLRTPFWPRNGRKWPNPRQFGLGSPSSAPAHLGARRVAKSVAHGRPRPLGACGHKFGNVGQVFLSADSGHFPIAAPAATVDWKVRGTGRHECPPYSGVFFLKNLRAQIETTLPTRKYTTP